MHTTTLFDSLAAFVPTPSVLATISGSDSTLLVAILAFFLLGAMGIVSIKKYKYRELRHETIRLLVEKGQPIPPELLDEKPETPKKRNDARNGILWIAIAVGWFVTFAIMSAIMVPAMEEADMTNAKTVHMSYLLQPEYVWKVVDFGSLKLMSSSMTQWLAIIPATIGLALLLNAWLNRRGERNDTSDGGKR